MTYVFIWDFDGVIVHTPHEDAWRMASEVYGIKGFNHDFYMKYVSGRPRLEGGKMILDLLGYYESHEISDEENKNKILQEFVELKNNIFHELIEQNIYEVNWDVINFILRARSKGIIQVLASASRNALPIAYRILLPNNIPLVSLFDINSSGSGSTKEEVFKNGINMVLEKYGEIKCGIIFDDAPSGILAGKRLGLKTVGYGDDSLKETGADIVINEFSNLDPLNLISILGCD